MTGRHTIPRRGYTLVEMLVATASASVLMVGLSGALFVAGQALDSDEGVVAVRADADMALARVMSDLREAREFKELSARTARFLVPDRDGDSLEDEIEYFWSGAAGDPLRMRVRGGTAYELIQNVQSLSFASLTRSMTALDVTIAPPPPWPVLESSSSGVVDPKEYSINLPAPAGVAAGDLLIAAVATDNDNAATMTPPAGWATLELSEQAGKVTLGIFWKLATDAEPPSYSFTWANDEEAAGVVLRISNQYAGTPITASLASGDKSNAPEAPTTSTTLDHSMVLRFCGFDKGKPGTVGDTGVANHTNVYMDGAANKVGAGCCYQIQTASGSTTTAVFDLGNSADWRSVTVVVAPAQ